MKASGKGHVYTKMQQDEERGTKLKVLMLKEGTTHTTWRDLLDEEGALGMIKKTAGDEPRYGLRFQDGTKMLATATKLNVTGQLSLGRFKLTAIREELGQRGVTAMVLSMKWTLSEVLYIDEGYAVVESTTCPTKSRWSVQRKDGTQCIMYVKAMNEKARKLFKQASVPCRSADDEGDDQADQKRRKEESNEYSKRQQAKKLREKEEAAKMVRDGAKELADRTATAKNDAATAKASGGPPVAASPLRKHLKTGPNFDLGPPAQ